METITPPPISQESYNHAANLLVNHNKTSFEVKNLMIARGLSSEQATQLVNELEDQILEAKKQRAKKDMLYGALWCVGGTILTIADTGFIFWGAIVFGGIQFIRGAINS